MLAALDVLIEEVKAGLEKPVDGLTRRWGTLQRGDLIGFAVGRLLPQVPPEHKDALVSMAGEIVRLVPGSAEFLTTVDRDVLGPATSAVDEAIGTLLRGEGVASGLSQRELHYAGIRGVVRALVQVGVGAVSDEWLTNVCLLTRSPHADLARYAAWSVSEWATRRALNGGAAPPTIVGLTLRSVASDARVSIRANGVRGLVALERTQATPRHGEVIRRHADDQRIAIRLALDGVGSF